MVRTRNTAATLVIGTGGCLGFLVIAFMWLIAAVLQLCFYGGTVACLIAVAYWLFTGEFIFAGVEVPVDPSVVVDQTDRASNR